MNNIAHFLMNVEPFNRIPAEEVQRLSLLCQVTRHAKGEVLYSEGDPAVHVWVLQEGRLDISKYQTAGHSLVIESIQPGDLFGTLCRLGSLNSSTYPCTAIAATDSVAVRFPDRFFAGLYNRFPAIVSGTCQLCSLRLGSIQQRTLAYQEPVRMRIVRALLMLQKTHGKELPYTKREIADLAATTVETTIRVLSVLQKQRVVASQRGQITLKNIPHLKALLTNTTKGDCNEHH